MRTYATFVVLVLFTLASRLDAQQFFTPGGEINGQIGVQVNATLNDGIGDYQPLADLPLTLYRGATDSLQLHTDEAGVLKFSVAPGTYRLSTPSPVRFHGRSYRWNIALEVKRGMGIVNLTVANAVVAGAPMNAPSSLPASAAQTSMGATRYYPKEVRDSLREPTRASSTRGLVLGLNLNGSAFRYDEGGSTPAGPGGSFQIGYGPTHKIAILADVTGALVRDDGEEAAFAHVDLMARFMFTSQTRRFAPFIEGGYSGFALAQSDIDLGDGTTGEYTLSGAGFTFGAGGQYFVSPRTALSVGLKWTRGEFNRLDSGGITVNDLGVDATTARFNLGVSWYPTSRR